MEQGTLPVSLAAVAGSDCPGLTCSRISDASFEVIGTPYSFLSVKISASQPLYTRRGTLVTVSGKAQNVGHTH